MKHPFSRLLDNYKEWGRALCSDKEKSSRDILWNLKKKKKEKANYRIAYRVYIKCLCLFKKSNAQS